MMQELEGFNWEMAVYLLEKYLRQCNFIAHLVFLKHQASQSCIP